MDDFKGLYDVRDYKDSDKSFVMATFLRGLYHGDTWFSLIPRNIFMDNYKHVIASLVANPTNTIKVACLREDPDVIIGYSVLGHNFQTVHWVYVKSAWRKRGIAKSLVPQYPTSFTHLSAVGKSLMSKYPTAVFNPFNL